MKLTVKAEGLTSDKLDFSLTETIKGREGDDILNTTGMSRFTILAGDVNSDKLAVGVASADKNTVYLFNATTTNESILMILVTCGEQTCEVGELAPGEWLKIPWSGTCGISLVNTNAEEPVLVEYMIMY